MIMIEVRFKGMFVLQNTSFINAETADQTAHPEATNIYRMLRAHPGRADGMVFDPQSLRPGHIIEIFHAPQLAVLRHSSVEVSKHGLPGLQHRLTDARGL